MNGYDHDLEPPDDGEMCPRCGEWGTGPCRCTDPRWVD